MEWNKEEVLQLIQAYRNKRLIWDTKNPLYFNKAKKQAAWEDVGEEMQKSAADCKKKMEYLLSALRREKMKMKRSLMNGDDKPYKSSWFAFESLQFLWKKNRRGVASTPVYFDEVKTEDLVTVHALPEPTVTFSPQLTMAAVPKKKRFSAASRRNSATHGVFHISPPTHLGDDECYMAATVSPKKKRFSSVVGYESDMNGSSHISPPSNPGEGECYYFGNLVGFKLRLYDDKVRCAIQNDIMNIFLRANQGFYDNIYQSASASTNFEPSTSSSSLHGCTSAAELTDRRSCVTSQELWPTLPGVKQELSPSLSPSPSHPDENC